jgi:hypothetical protein
MRTETKTQPNRPCRRVASWRSVVAVATTTQRYATVVEFAIGAWRTPIVLSETAQTQTMFGGFGGGAMGIPPQRFEECYHCYSVAYADKSHLEVSQEQSVGQRDREGSVGSQRGPIHQCNGLIWKEGMRLDRMAAVDKWWLASWCVCCSCSSSSYIKIHEFPPPHRHDHRPRPTDRPTLKPPERRQDPPPTVGL